MTDEQQLEAAIASIDYVCRQNKEERSEDSVLRMGFSMQNNQHLIRKALTEQLKITQGEAFPLAQTEQQAQCMMTALLQGWFSGYELVKTAQESK